MGTLYAGMSVILQEQLARGEKEERKTQRNLQEDGGAGERTARSTLLECGRCNC